MKTIKIDEEKLKRFKICETQIAEIEQAIFDSEEEAFEVNRENDDDVFESDIRQWVRQADQVELEALVVQILDILGY